MFFTLEEISQWLGVTAYEIWVCLTSLSVFTVLLCLKIDAQLNLSWWTVFSPIFIGDALNLYFLIIIFIRMYLEKKMRPAIKRSVWSFLQLSLFFLTEYFLCTRLSNPEPSRYEYSEILAPLFILSQFIMIRACQLH